jgi:hypothetical protein
MIRKTVLLLSLPFVYIAFTGFKPSINNDNLSPANLISQFIDKIDNTSTLKLTILIKEKISDKYITHQANFKIQRNPYRIYMRESYPYNGREVLYVEGKNDNKALINPASFPWTTLSLSPIGNMMRNNNHHSIFKAGFFFINEVLKHMKTKYQSQLSTMLKYEGQVKYNNFLCYKITFDNPSYGYTTYKTLANESLEDISNKLMIDDYKVLLLNPQIKSFEEVKPGMILKVPNDYGKSFTLYFSTETNLMMGIRVYDENGLWEEYSYSDIVLNPTFADKDFSSANPDYNF